MDERTKIVALTTSPGYLESLNLLRVKLTAGSFFSNLFQTIQTRCDVLVTNVGTN